jgi:NitT/TauT family transport system permease protein
MIATLLRLVIAYVFAVIVSYPLAILIVHNHFAERFLLPIFDIVQSIPVLAFFPVVITAFAKTGAWNTAAVFIIFLAMIWNIVFNLISALKAVPKDIEYAAEVFHIRGLDYFFKILLPSSVPGFITGSLLAFAQGWNIIIVAEVFHVYLSQSNAPDLFGIGSIMVNASASGNTQVFLSAIILMIFVIAMIDFFVWQKLLKYGERFKFD